MTPEEVRSAVGELIRKNFAVEVRDEDFHRPLPSIRDLDYDSLRVLELMGLVEERFEVCIDFVDDDIQFVFETADRICQLIIRKMSVPKPPLAGGLT